MNMIQKQKKKKEKDQEKKEREERREKREKEEEKEESSEEEEVEPARNSVFGLARDSQGAKIVINESDESSEEQEGIDDLKTHAHNVQARSKISNRTQSEVVSPVSKTKKQSTPLANHSLPATGNLIGWDPFAPNATSQPQIQPQNLANRVNKKNKRNKTTSTPVQDPKLKPMPVPYDPFQAPLSGSSSSPFNGNSSFPSLMPNNNIFNSPTSSSPNPFAVQQSPINQPWPALNNSLGQSNPSQPTFFSSPTVNNTLGAQSNPFFSPSVQQPVNHPLGGSGSNPNFFAAQQSPFTANTSPQVNQQQSLQQLQQLQQQQLQQFQQPQTPFKDTNPFTTPQGFYGGFQPSSAQGIFGNSNF